MAIEQVKARGGIVVIVAHRPSALQAVDDIGLIQGGKLVAFGPREKILPTVQPRAAAAGTTSAPVSGPAAAERTVSMPRTVGHGEQPTILHGRIPA